MGRQFQATIPGQRGHEPVRQPPHVLGERLHDRARRKAGQPDETDVARTPLDQRRHVGLSRAGEILARARALATHRDDHELRGEPHLHTLAALIAAHPDRTLAELKDALATPASVPTVWRAVRALGLTVKKNGPPVRTRSA